MNLLLKHLLPVSVSHSSLKDIYSENVKEHTEQVITMIESVLGALYCMLSLICLNRLHLHLKLTVHIFLCLCACSRACCRPRSCPISRSPTCPSSPTSLRRRCLPPSSTTRSCRSGKRRNHCSVSLTLASTRPVSTTSVLPASDLPATRDVPSSRSLVSSAGRAMSAQTCLSVVYFTGDMI